MTLLSTVTDPRHLKHADEEGEKKKIEKKRRNSFAWNLFDKEIFRSNR